MSDNNVNVSVGGWPLFITALLCILKLTGVISISWWWCFCLFWLPFVIIFGVLGLIAVITIPFLIIFLIVEICRK